MKRTVLIIGLLCILTYASVVKAQTSDATPLTLGEHTGFTEYSGREHWYSFDTNRYQNYKLTLYRGENTNTNFTFIVWYQSEYTGIGTGPSDTGSFPLEFTFLGNGSTVYIEVYSNDGDTGSFDLVLEEDNSHFLPEQLHYLPSIKTGDYAEWTVEQYVNSSSEDGNIFSGLKDGDTIRITALQNAPIVTMNYDNFDFFPIMNSSYGRAFNVTVNGQLNNITGIEPFFLPTEVVASNGSTYDMLNYLRYGIGFLPESTSFSEDQGKIQFNITSSIETGSISGKFTIDKNLGILTDMQYNLGVEYFDGVQEQYDYINMNVTLTDSHLTAPIETSSASNNLPISPIPAIFALLAVPITLKKFEKY